MLKKIALIACCTALLACASYPLGMEEEEWLSLSAEQKLEAREKQADINLQMAEIRAKKEAREQEERVARFNMRKALYSGRNDVWSCSLKAGVVNFLPGWRTPRSTAFDIANGDGRLVAFYSEDGKRRTHIWVELEGYNLSLCRKETFSDRSQECGCFSATTADLARGISWPTGKIESTLSGSKLSCSLRNPLLVN